MGDNIVRDRHVGRFRIAIDLINDDPLSALEVLRDVIVLRAEFMVIRNQMAYVGIHPDFAELEEGHEAPRYEATLAIETDGDGNVVRRERQWVPVAA